MVQTVTTILVAATLLSSTIAAPCGVVVDIEARKNVTPKVPAVKFPPRPQSLTGSPKMRPRRAPLVMPKSSGNSISLHRVGHKIQNPAGFGAAALIARNEHELLEGRRIVTPKLSGLKLPPKPKGTGSPKVIPHRAPSLTTPNPKLTNPNLSSLLSQKIPAPAALPGTLIARNEDEMLEGREKPNKPKLDVSRIAQQLKKGNGLSKSKPGGPILTKRKYKKPPLSELTKVPRLPKNYKPRDVGLEARKNGTPPPKFNGILPKLPPMGHGPVVHPQGSPPKFSGILPKLPPMGPGPVVHPQGSRPPKLGIKREELDERDIFDDYLLEELD